MRYAFCLAALLAALSAVPAFAGNGHVPQSTLAVLGLADMEILSDEEGMQVRGQGGSAATMGLSLVMGLLIDPATKSFVFGADTNVAAASAESSSLITDPVASHETASSVSLDLDVTTDTSVYSGVLIGGAGGSGYASAR